MAADLPQPPPRPNKSRKTNSYTVVKTHQFNIMLTSARQAYTETYNMGRKKMTLEAAPVKFNKSARIRELHDAGRSAKEIKQSLDADGHETTINTIYTAIANHKKAKAGGSAGNGKILKPTTEKARATHSVAAGGNTVGNGLVALQDVTAVIALARKFGGVDSLIGVLESLKGL